MLQLLFWSQSERPNLRLHRWPHCMNRLTNRAKNISWVIREKVTGRVICETFNHKAVDALNTDRYEAVPILEYLQSLNRLARI